MIADIKKGEAKDKEGFQHLMQLYLYDFSEFLPLDLDENGTFKETVLEDYFINQSKTPFLIFADNKLAGFILVTSETLLKGNHGGRCIQELFIARRHRRKGVGKAAAMMVWSLFPGKWEIKVVNTNGNARKFWEATIKEYTNDSYQQDERDDQTWRGCIFSLQTAA